MPHIRVENSNFQMGGKILFWVDEIVLFFQFRVEISTQDTKKAAMTFSIITASSVNFRKDKKTYFHLRDYSLGG